MAEESTSSAQGEEVPPPRGLLREVWADWGPPLIAVILIRLFIFEPFRIPSSSMVPSLLIGDYVVVSKFAYGLWLPFKSVGIPFTSIGLPLDNVEVVDWADPQRGDIVVFHYPRDEDITYIKRVVGVPGDTLRVIDNQVVLNGERLPHRLMGPFEDHDATCRTRDARQWSTELPRTDGPPQRMSILTDQRFGGMLANHREIVIPDDHVFVMGDNRDHSEDSRAWGLVRDEQLKGKAHFVWMSWNACGGSFPGNLRFERMPSSLYADGHLPDPER